MNEYYKVLGLSPHTPFDDVKKQYNKLVKQYHPDINPNGHEQFQQIQEAFNKIKTAPKPSKIDSASSLDIDLDRIFKSDAYRYNKKPKTITVDIHASVQEYLNGNFYRVIVLDNGMKYHYTFPKGIVPYKTKKTDTIIIDGKEFALSFNFNLDDVDVKYDYDTGRFVKYIKLSAQEFYISSKIPVYWDNDVYEVNISNVSTDQLLKLKGKGFYNSARKTNEDLYLKIIVYKGD